MKQTKLFSAIVFLLELGTMLYFIPLLIYLAEFSFGIPVIGFLVGVLAIVHYYIYRWYHDRGSLVYFGLSITGGALAAALTMFFNLFKKVFFPAIYLTQYSHMFLPKITVTDVSAVYYYFVFLTGIVYVAVLRIILTKICGLLGVENCPIKKICSSDRQGI